MNRISGAVIYRRLQRTSAVSKRVALIVACIGYFFLFVVAYQQMIAVFYAYQAFYLRQIPAWCWLIMATLAAAPTTILDTGFSRVSSLVTWVIYFATVVPCCVVPEMIAKGDLIAPLQCSTVVVAGFILFELVRRGPLFRLRSSGANKYLSTILLSVIVISSGIAMMYWDNFRFDLRIGPEDYVHRFEAREIVQTGSFIGYLFSMFASTALPMVIGDAISLRSFWLAAIALFGAVASMSFSGAKAQFFAPLICGLVIWVTTRRRHAWWWYILVGHLALLAVSAMEISTVGTPFLLALGPVREQAVPAQLTAYYFDLANTTPPLLLRDSSIMQSIGSRNPLGKDLPRFVGEEIVQVDGQNANANIWASAQVELPYVGPMLASIIAGIILRLLDSVVAMKGSKRAWMLGASLCAMWALAWSNGAIQTTLLSNGVIPGLIFLYLVPTRDISPIRRAPRISAPLMFRGVRIW